MPISKTGPRGPPNQNNIGASELKPAGQANSNLANSTLSSTEMSGFRPSGKVNSSPANPTLPNADTSESAKPSGSNAFDWGKTHTVLTAQAEKIELKKINQNLGSRARASSLWSHNGYPFQAKQAGPVLGPKAQSDQPTTLAELNQSSIAAVVPAGFKPQTAVTDGGIQTENQNGNPDVEFKGEPENMQETTSEIADNDSKKEWNSELTKAASNAAANAIKNLENREWKKIKVSPSKSALDAGNEVRTRFDESKQAEKEEESELNDKDSKENEDEPKSNDKEDTPEEEEEKEEEDIPEEK
jgi:hypothetical protein